MVFIHVKTVGSKKYYTLRLSVRNGDKVIVKDLCSLGSDLSKIKIGDLEKKYSKEIRRSYKTIKRFLDKNIYLEKVRKKRIKDSPFYSRDQILEIEAVKHHYDSKFKKIDRLTQKEIYELFIINFAVNSTAIEGNTITLKEAINIFQEDIMPKDRTLREVYDLTNTKKVINFLNEKKPNMNLNLMIKVHDMLLDHIDKRVGLRNHDIHIFGQPFKPTPARYVRSDLKILMDWYKKEEKKMHPLAVAVLFHHKFENIHPFSDGNGRTGRVLMNYILTMKGYPPLVVPRRLRKEYLTSMNQADNSIKKSLISADLEDYKSLLDFMQSQLKASYWDIFLF